MLPATMSKPWALNTRPADMSCAARVHLSYRVSLYDKPDIKKYVLQMSSMFDSNYRCKQVSGLKNDAKSRTRTGRIDEQLGASKRIPTT
jgi:hypothetical protein